MSECRNVGMSEYADEKTFHFIGIATNYPELKWNLPPIIPSDSSATSAVSTSLDDAQITSVDF